MTSVTERGRHAQVGGDPAGSHLPVAGDDPQGPCLVGRQVPGRRDGGTPLPQPPGHPHDEVTEVGLGLALGLGRWSPGNASAISLRWAHCEVTSRYDFGPLIPHREEGRP